MPRRFRSSSRLLLLFAMAGAAAFLAERSWTSVTDYRTPYAFHFPLAAGEPLTGRVALVVLDGIRLDVSSQMSNLSLLARRGSSGVARAALPSLSNPNRAVMVTGARPEVNGVTNNGSLHPPPVDSLFSLAGKQGLTTVVAGSSFWWRAFGDHLTNRSPDLGKGPGSPTAVEDLIAWQKETCDKGIPFLEKHAGRLLVAEITAADKAGHAFGGASEAYRQVVQTVDHCLGEMVRAFDDGDTTFVVVSDHGHIDRRGGGGHGGSETEVLQVPLVLAGRAIAPGSGWRAEMVDVAPTISALLGLPLPSTNQGNVLWHALRIPEEAAQPLRERVARQKEMLAAVLPDRATRVEESKQQRVLPSALAAALAAGLAALILGQWRRWAALVLSAAAYYACYYLLFFVFGLGYSLSAVNREEYLLSFLGRDLIAAGIAIVSACLLAARLATETRRLLVLDLALLIACTLVLQVAAIHYGSGLIMQTVVPDLRASFKAYLDLLQLVAIGPAASVVFVVFWMMDRKRSPNAQVKPAVSGDGHEFAGVRNRDR